MYCFNRPNGIGCEMKCCKVTGERYPLVSNGKGGEKCTCPVCECPCQVVYKFSAVSDIKCGLLSEKELLKLNPALPDNVSKLKVPFTVEQSNHIIAKKLKTHLDTASKMGPDSLLCSDSNLSNVQETAYELTATELAKDIHRHKQYVDQTLHHVTPLMTEGKGTFIVQADKLIDVRFLHRSARIHEQNNNLDRNVISKLRRASGNTKSDAIDVDDPYSVLENAAPGKENAQPSPSKRSERDLGVNEIQDTESVTYADPDELYEAVASLCFLRAEQSDENIEDKEYYQTTFGHLSSDVCKLCLNVCKNAIRLQKQLTAAQGLQKIDDYMTSHFTVGL